MLVFDQNNIDDPSRVLARKSESGNLILGTSEMAKIREIPGFEICRTSGFETLELIHSNPVVLICNEVGFKIGDQLIEKGDVVYLDAGDLSTIEFSSACICLLAIVFWIGWLLVTAVAVSVGPILLASSTACALLITNCQQTSNVYYI